VKMMNKKPLSTTEKKILRLLYQTEAELSVYEIAKEIHISFPTAKKYVEKLKKEGYLD